MALELKIESLRARGELSVQERDRLLAAIGAEPAAGSTAAPSRRRRRRLPPLRSFLLGMACGVALAYLVWGLFTSGA